MKIVSMAFLLLSFNSAAEYIYQTPEASLRAKASHEITNFPTIRSQDGVGLCYAFSATQLINFQHCKQNQLDCSRRENQLSALQIGSYYQYRRRVVNDGGHTGTVLSNIKNENPQLVSEECLPYEKMAHQSPKMKGNKENEGYHALKKIYDLNPRRMSEEEKACHAKTIKEILPINKSLEQIFKAFEAYSFEEFVYDVAVKDECGADQGRSPLPKFHIQTWPSRETTYTSTIMHLEKLLLNDIPVSISVCASDGVDPKRLNDTCGGHAMTITGIKEACDFNGCKTLLKVHNSYGQSWQDYNNDGWLEAAPIIERAFLFDKTRFLTYISQYPKDQDIPKKSLPRTQAVQDRSSAPARNQDTMPTDIDQSRGPIFRCDGGYFGDQWQPGKNCKLFRYTR